MCVCVCVCLPLVPEAEEVSRGCGGLPVFSPPPGPGLPTCLICVCLGSSVYCDDADLENIPPLPQTTAYLYARFNRISHIRAGDFKGLSMYICIYEYVYVYVSMSWQRKEWVGRGNPSVLPLATQPHRAVISVPHLCQPFAVAFSLSSLEISLIPGLVGSSAAEVICSCFCSTKLWEAGEEKL